MFTLLLFCSCYQVPLNVRCLFLAVPWDGLRSVIVTFPGHSQLFFGT